jgi:hypothetical protein
MPDQVASRGLVLATIGAFGFEFDGQVAQPPIQGLFENDLNSS